jgi:hypothetical protein
VSTAWHYMKKKLKKRKKEERWLSHPLSRYGVAEPRVWWKYFLKWTDLSLKNSTSKNFNRSRIRVRVPCRVWKSELLWKEEARKVLNRIFARRRWTYIYFFMSLHQRTGQKKKLHSPIRYDKCPKEKTSYQLLMQIPENIVGEGEHCASLPLKSETQTPSL